MIHTYRDPYLHGTERSPARTLFAAGAFVLLVTLLFLGLARTGFTWAERAQLLGAVALTCGLAALLSSRYSQRVCSEIRLDDDGTCEFATRRGVIALHVRQITAVEYDNDGDSRCEYRVRYRGGKIAVEAGMSAFTDFLARLSTLNPTVDLSSIPARIWHH